MCAGNIIPQVIVDNKGLAQCASAAQGTFFVLAGKGASVMNPDGPAQLKIFGSAQMTCP
jgi:hypothetical protein